MIILTGRCAGYQEAAREFKGVFGWAFGYGFCLQKLAKAAIQSHNHKQLLSSTN
jgi:hypothetical protein